MIPAAVEVLVVGAGPAGIAAAVHAAEAGKRVLIVDEGARAGGQIWRHAQEGAAPRDALGWLARLEAAGVAQLTGATVFDAPAPGALRVLRGIDAADIRYEQLIIATGARELLLPFPGWTLPGVVGVGGAQALLKAGLDVRGRRAVVAGSGPLLLPVAALLAERGARVITVAEQADRARVASFAASLWRTPRRALRAARLRVAARAAPYRTATWVSRALGSDRVSGAVLREGTATRELACDLLCVGYGLVPETRLARLVGCAVEHGRVQVDALQRTSVAGVWCAGEPTGIAGAEAALATGTVAGLAAAGDEPAARARTRSAARHVAFAERMAQAFQLRPELASLADDETIVCRCEDVTMAAIRSCRGSREAKLFTRAGMGACQGRVCGSALEHIFGWEADRVRAPLIPVPMAALHPRPTEES